MCALLSVVKGYTCIRQIGASNDNRILRTMKICFSKLHLSILAFDEQIFSTLSVTITKSICVKVSWLSCQY